MSEILQDTRLQLLYNTWLAKGNATPLSRATHCTNQRHESNVSTTWTAFQPPIETARGAWTRAGTWERQGNPYIKRSMY